MAEEESGKSRQKAAAPAPKRPKATIHSRYLLPLATAMLVGVCFLVYYLTYVQQHREYLLSRNYRMLATLGDQMSETLSNQMAVLTSYIEGFENGEYDDRGVETYKRTRGQKDQLLAQQLDRRVSDQFDLSETIHSLAPRLNHIRLKYFDPKGATKDRAEPGLVRRDGEWSFQLAVTDDDGDHEGSATIGVQDLAQSFSPSISETFDDVLIANQEGSIVFQRQRIGPHFSALSDLVKAAPREAKAESKEKAGEAGGGPGGSPSDTSSALVETELAGVPYLVFLEPVTLDLNPTRNAVRSLHFTVLGLVPARRFRWESLAISYKAVIALSSFFLLLCLSTPIVRIAFLNDRGRIRLGEIVLLPLLFAAISGSLTAICLQSTYFSLRHDDTDRQLDALARRMQQSIRGEVMAMRRQLMAACHEPDLQEDLRAPYLVVRTSVRDTEFQTMKQTMPYPSFRSMSWTDARGRQIVKWSATEQATPLINIRRLDFFRNLDLGRVYFLENDDRPFRFDSVLPPNEDSHVAVLGMKMSDCSGPEDRSRGAEFAFLAAQPRSLIDPVLPIGVGFALVDDSGKVLFHSDKFRNNRENILVETSNDRELIASIYGHSNEETFSLSYRGNEIRARVVPVSGVLQSPWSLIVYKDAQYVQTYDLEVLTMAGALLIGYLSIPTLIVFVLYFVAKPAYMPAWLWPTESRRDIYRFQVEAATAMLALSAGLLFLRPVEESLFAAAAAGYVTLMVVCWSTLLSTPRSAGKTAFEALCGLVAFGLTALALEERWWWSVPIGLAFPAAWLLNRGGYLLRARWPLSRASYRWLYTARSMVLLSVIGVAPPLSFFRNSKLLEDTLHIRAAQLHAAIEWNEKASAAPDARISAVADASGGARCGGWGVYLCSYYETAVTVVKRPAKLPAASSDRLDEGFLRLAHFLHHSFNQIGAEAMGVLRLPEGVYVPGDLPEWQWEWAQHEDPDHPLHLRVFEGGGKDLVVSSALPTGHTSAATSILTWLFVLAAMSMVFMLLLRRVFLIGLQEPVAQSDDELRDAMKHPGSLLLLTPAWQGLPPDVESGGRRRVDLRELAAEPDWGEKFTKSLVKTELPVVVENFDWEIGVAEADKQRLILTEFLVAGGYKTILVSVVDPTPFVIENRGPRLAASASRWAAVLGGFTRINVGWRSTWAAGEEIAKRLPDLFEQCSVQPELHAIGDDLARAWAQCPDKEQIVAEVAERASQYYHLVWRSCTQEECFLLAGLASDGVVNPRNTASLRQLLRRKLIVRDPQFRIMNESFRRFVLEQSVEMRREWDAEAAGSGWGKASGSFATAMVMVGLFLLSTQQQFLQTSSGLLTAAGGAAVALLKLIGLAEGKNSDA